MESPGPLPDAVSAPVPEEPMPDRRAGPAEGPGPGTAPEAVAPVAEPPSHRRVPLLAIVLIVVLLLVVPLLLVGAILPSFHPLSAPSSPEGPQLPPSVAQTYSQAYAPANRSAQATGAGGWGLVSAEGLATEVASAFPGNFSSSTCTPRAPPPVPAVTVESLSSGEAALWVFGFEDTAGDSLSVLVLNGSAQVFGESAASSHCAGFVPALLPHPDRLMDSSTAAGLISASWSITLGSTTTAFAAYLLSDELGASSGTQEGTAYWEILASPCSLGALASGGIAEGDPHLLAGFNATASDVVADWLIPGIGSCESVGSLNHALLLGNPRSETSPSGALDYSISVNAVVGPLTASAFHPEIVADTNQSLPTVRELDLLGPTDQILAVYNFSQASWTVGGSSGVGAAGSLGWQSPADLGSASLVLVANAPETGDIATYLP